MKDRALIYLSLVSSIAAFSYAAWVHAHAAQLAEQAVQGREQQFVQTFAPKIKDVYLGLGVTNAVVNPKTLDELFSPYLETLNRMVTPPTANEKKAP